VNSNCIKNVSSGKRRNSSLSSPGGSLLPTYVFPRELQGSLVTNSLQPSPGLRNTFARLA